MTFLKRVFRIPLLPTSVVENQYLKKYLKHGNTKYTLVKYDLEYIHGEIVSKGSLIGEMNLCNNFIPHYTSETYGKLLLTRNLGVKQNGLIYFGHQDYQIVCGISSSLTNKEIRNLTLGWITNNN
jgi:hypothetical protein